MKNKIASFSDSELLASLKTGSEHSFKELFGRFYGKAYHYLLKFTKSKETAEELAQDVFVKIWQYRESIDEASPFDALLFTIAKNAVLNHLRSRNSVYLNQKAYGKQIELKSNHTEESIFFEDYLRISEDAINKLSPQRKSIFKLSRYEGKSYDEIALTMGISKNTVRVQMIKSLKLIKDFLIAHNIQSGTLLVLASMVNPS